MSLESVAITINCEYSEVKISNQFNVQSNQTRMFTYLIIYFVHICNSLEQFAKKKLKVIESSLDLIMLSIYVPVLRSP